MKYGLLMLSLLFIHSAQAVDMAMEIGSGTFYTKDTNLLLVGITAPADPFLGTNSYHQLNIGGWTGPRNASVVGVAKGLQWDFAHTYVRLSTGGSLISNTSDRLSTAFQFYEQFMIRYNAKGLNIALSYRHWSNANIKEPNYGMDFLGLQIEKQF
jgi:hypothetical protein